MAIAALLVVAVLLGAQISELFDSWDNTFQTGNDIEFNLTIVALCVGACFFIAKLLWRSSRNLTPEIHVFLSQRLLLFSHCACEVRSILISPSPPPLRI